MWPPGKLGHWELWEYHNGCHTFVCTHTQPTHRPVIPTNSSQVSPPQTMRPLRKFHSDRVVCCKKGRGHHHCYQSWTSFCQWGIKQKPFMSCCAVNAVQLQVNFIHWLLTLGLWDKKTFTSSSATNPDQSQASFISDYWLWDRWSGVRQSDCPHLQLVRLEVWENQRKPPASCDIIYSANVRVTSLYKLLNAGHRVFLLSGHHAGQRNGCLICTPVLFTLHLEVQASHVHTDISGMIVILTWTVITLRPSCRHKTDLLVWGLDQVLLHETYKLPTWAKTKGSVWV